MFKKASKSQSRLRLALIGIAGSGKTVTALRIAKGLGDRIAVIDTERGSASKYAGEHCDFDVAQLESFAPQKFIEALRAADEQGYDVVIIDSLSHAWMGKGGALEMVDAAAKRSQSRNSFAAWRDVTPQHNALVDAILQSRCHVIVTMRAKTAYDVEDVGGKKVPKKIGTSPQQKEGLEFEFDVVADLDADHNMLIGKTRCSALDGKVYHCAGEDVAIELKRWLTDGAPYIDARTKFALELDELMAKLDKCTEQSVLLGLREKANGLRQRMDQHQDRLMRETIGRATDRVARTIADRAEAIEAERHLSAVG